MAELREGTFRADQLVEVDTSRDVILASGGPLMRLESVFIHEGVTRAFCSFPHEGAPQGRARMCFPVTSLRVLRPLDPAEWLQ
jgi:hypothetical protein